MAASTYPRTAGLGQSILTWSIRQRRPLRHNSVQIAKRPPRSGVLRAPASNASRANRTLSGSPAKPYAYLPFRKTDRMMPSRNVPRTAHSCANTRQQDRGMLLFEWHRLTRPLCVGGPAVQQTDSHPDASGNNSFSFTVEFHSLPTFAETRLRSLARSPTFSHTTVDWSQIVAVGSRLQMQSAPCADRPSCAGGCFKYILSEAGG